MPLATISVLGGVVTMTNVSSVYGRCSTLEDHSDGDGLAVDVEQVERGRGRGSEQLHGGIPGVVVTPSGCPARPFSQYVHV